MTTTEQRKRVSVRVYRCTAPGIMLDIRASVSPADRMKPPLQAGVLCFIFTFRNRHCRFFILTGDA